MPDRTDVLVIGGGVAGVAAALAATRAGARVTLVRAAPGATALATGAWDAPPPAPLGEALAAAGLPLQDCAGALPHPDGSLVHCATSAAAHAHAALTTGAERAIVCGIAGLPTFRPAPLASLWTDAAGLLEGSLRSVTLTLPDTPPAGWSPVSLAARLERDPQLLGAAIAHAAREAGAARAIVPAVIGALDHVRTLEAVQHTAGVQIGEALGTAPSLPGWRLDVALVRAAATAGIAIVRGHVTGHTTDGRRISSVTVATSDGVVTIGCGACVLATGKFVGGGIAADAVYREPALDCEVAVERFTRTISDAGAALVLTDPARLEPQPLLAIGVHTNERGQPMRASGEVAYDNVVAAGGVRAGTDAGAGGLGSAAHEGWNAGTLAVTLTL